jgi:hypothetical protein
MTLGGDAGADSTLNQGSDFDGKHSMVSVYYFADRDVWEFSGIPVDVRRSDDLVEACVHNSCSKHFSVEISILLERNSEEQPHIRGN